MLLPKVSQSIKTILFIKIIHKLTIHKLTLAEKAQLVDILLRKKMFHLLLFCSASCRCRKSVTEELFFYSLFVSVSCAGWKTFKLNDLSLSTDFAT